MENFKKIFTEDFKISIIGDALIKASPIVFICLVLIMFSTFFTYETNLTTSMYPVIEEGSGLIGVRYFKDIKRGDIVSFSNKSGGHEWVKRVLGLPGETIEFIDNQIFIDGKVYEDSYTLNGENSPNVMAVLANDEYFVVGDNRSVSMDSRYIGPIKRDIIQSKIVSIFNIAKCFGVDASGGSKNSNSFNEFPSDLEPFNSK